MWCGVPAGWCSAESHAVVAVRGSRRRLLSSGVTLEEQLAALAGLGLELAADVGVQDLLYSFPREEYEGEPFGLLLFMFGSQVEAEPWGRWCCERAWNFDTECVEGPGAYVEIARQLSRVAGRPEVLTEVRDHVDIDARQAWIEYTVDARRQRRDIEVNDDWADWEVVERLMGLLERDGRRFYCMDNGQAVVLFYLDDQSARRLNELAGRQLLKIAH
jgi:hypothetical protein